MFEQVKANLFTIAGLITTFIHVFLVVGFICCYVAFQTQVMGVDPFAPKATVSGGKR
jgi:hypothetical protein